MCHVGSDLLCGCLAAPRRMNNVSNEDTLCSVASSTRVVRGLKLSYRIDLSKLRSRRLCHVARAWSPTCLAQWLQREADNISATCGSKPRQFRRGRYKQALARPGAITATLDYYRSFVDRESRRAHANHAPGGSVPCVPIVKRPQEYSSPHLATRLCTLEAGLRQAKCRRDRRCPVFLGSFEPK